MHWILIVALGFIVGILVGMMGIGGGLIVVPTLVHLAGMDQHLAQGTSLFILLPPLGLGALSVYWKKGEVDLRAGIVCALGILIGGFAGGRMAVDTSSSHLESAFGGFLMFAAVLVWRRARPKLNSGGEGG
ncbi:MAG TPA: TSUP family transporter [Candidatus Acidoferrales bacterium]|nr:TSUP family transporter [Candidatus Acidoferrales bacterium]